MPRWLRSQAEFAIIEKKRKAVILNLNAVKAFLKSQIVLVISALAAVVSFFFVPSGGRNLHGCIDTTVLILLGCLMAVIAGLRSVGLFERMTAVLLRRAGSVRALGMILMNLCFFTSMFVTNDVALITFVPLTVLLFEKLENRRALLLTVVIETAAANLGSMMTPIGNPQNLYLYTAFGLTLPDFFRILLPLGIAGYLLLALTVMLLRSEPIAQEEEEEQAEIPKTRLICYLVLFAVCILTVLRVVPDPLCLLITAAAVLIIDRRLFAKIDYALLGTFVCFFIFVANIKQIPSVSEFLQSVLAGRELLVAALLSQGISNVPAAMLLSGFTDQVEPLLKGVNIGGLGTPIASLASLISYRIYAKSRLAEPGRYLGIFLCINALMLLILLLLTLLPLF